MAQVSIPYQQIAAPAAGVVQNGYVYIGVAGTLPDPDRASTWATVYANGAITTQPIRTNANGVMVDGSGSPKIFTVDAAAFSLLVQDRSGIDVYRVATVQQITDGSVGTSAIAPKAVTYDKIQDVTQNRLLGRRAGSDGQIDELTISSGLEITTGGAVRIPSNGITTSMILDDAVSYAKMQNSTADRLLGRRSGSDGNLEELTHSSDFTITAGGELQLSSAGFASLGASGYIRLPGGIIVQWGQASAAAASSAAITFPVAFPNAVYRIVMGMQLASASPVTVGVGYGGATTSGFTYYNSNTAGAVTADYIAIGR